MAFTKVVGAGIHTLSNIASHNINSSGIITATKFVGPMENGSGISTFYDLRVTNNLTVDGTTTTLDTTLIGVDRVEVGANSNSIVGVAVTQSGTADIVRLYDGASQVVTVDDEGKVGLGTDTPSAPLHLHKTSGTALIKLENINGSSQLDIRHTNGYGAVHYAYQGTEKWRVGQTAQTDHFSVYQSSGVSDGLPYRLFIQNNGEVGINTSDPTDTLHLLRNSANHGIALQRAGTNPGTALVQVHSNGVLSLQGGNNIHYVSGGSQQHIWYRASTEIARFDINGRLGIGTNAPDTLVEIGNAIGTGTANLLKLTSYTNSQSSRPGIAFWNNNPNTAQAQISAKGGASYNASKLHFSVANSSRVLADRACIDEFGTFIIGPGETRRNTKGSNQHQVLLIEGTGNNSTRMSMIRSSNDDNGPEIQIIKTRGTSVGSVTKPNQNDYLGAFVFLAGDDSDLFTRGAEIGVQATGTPANDRCPSDIIFSTTPTSGASTPQEAVRITSAGSIGINSTSPDRRFTLHQDATCRMNLKSLANSTAGIEFGDPADHNIGYIVYDNTNDSMQFGVNAGERLRINSSGKVGINQASNIQTRLHVSENLADSASLSWANSTMSLLSLIHI